MTCQKKHEIKKRSTDDNSEKPSRDFSFVTNVLKSKVKDDVADSIVSNPSTEQNFEPNNSVDEIKKRSVDDNSEKSSRDFSFVTNVLKSKANEEAKDEVADSIVSNPSTGLNVEPNNSVARNQANLMHLLQLRQRQREIEGKLEQVVHSALQQTRLNKSY